MELEISHLETRSCYVRTIVLMVVFGVCFFLPVTAWSQDEVLEAARTGNIALAKKTIRRGGDVNVVNSNGKTALHIASGRNLPDMVSILIAAGADLDKHEGQAGSPLFAAVLNGFVEVSQILLEAGADISVTSGPEEKNLGNVADLSNPLMAQLLKRYKVDINIADEAGNTIVHYGTRKLISTFSSLSMKKTINPEKDQTKDIEEAISAFKSTLQAGVDPNVRNAKGETAMGIAVQSGNGKIISALAQSGADPNADPINLFISIRSLDRFQSLLNAGADPNIIGDVCKTKYSYELTCSSQRPGTKEPQHILHYAIRKAELPIIRALLEAGSDPNFGNPENALTLSLQSRSSAPELFSLMLDYGATLEGAGVKKGTYLPHRPYWRGTFISDAENWIEENQKKRDIIFAFLNAGADPNDKNPENGDLPLTFAIDNGELNIVRLLLNAGSNVAGDTSILEYAIFQVTRSKNDLKRACLPPQKECRHVKQLIRDRTTIIQELVAAGAPVASAVGEDIHRMIGKGSALARLATSIEDYKDVLREFKNAQKEEPLWPPVYYYLGMGEQAAGNYPEALRYLQIYLALAARSENTRNVKNKIYLLEVLADRYVSEEDVKNIMFKLSYEHQYYDKRWEFSGNSSPRTSNINFDRLCDPYKRDENCTDFNAVIHKYINVQTNNNEQSTVKVDGNFFQWDVVFHWCPPELSPDSCPIRTRNECEVVSPVKVMCKGHEFNDYAMGGSNKTADFKWEYNYR